MANKNIIEEMAENYVNMWLEHDKKHFDRCESLLTTVNSSLFNFKRSRLKKASRYLINAFKIHDKIEENNSWSLLNKAKAEIEKYYKILCIPIETASFTTGVWKSHHKKNYSDLITALIKEQKNISRRVTGSEKHAVLLAGLWFVGAAAHDMRDVKLGLNSMKLYFSVLLKNKIDD